MPGKCLFADAALNRTYTERHYCAGSGDPAYNTTVGRVPLRGGTYSAVYKPLRDQSALRRRAYFSTTNSSWILPSASHDRVTRRLPLSVKTWNSGTPGCSARAT